MKCAIILVIVAVLCVQFSVTNGELDVVSVIESIPSEERLEFIKFYAQRGYNLLTQQNDDDHGENSKSMPDEFAINLYEYIQTRELICFTDGTCIDVGDVGIYPKF
ncbi:uncharacterized protein [Onthophagus taurus]|uniref:uncharacterized protein n=1 Tax=Onthophagus taurus TaxID=166361 RepID=UPI000C2071C1|nr:uncharacterized protein LOC111413827 [Onthophagus taurus]